MPLGAREVLAGLGVDADQVAFADERRHLDHDAGLERRPASVWLVAVAPLMAGTVSMTFRSTVGGSSMPTGSSP